MAYSSEYYDPIKAHEYYEKHKKLKGKTSTAGLNEDGRIAAKYVKQKLTEERKAKTETLKKSMNSRIEGIRRKIKAIKGTKGTSKQKKEQLRKEITELREEFKEKKTSIKSQYDDRYVAELNKIKSDTSKLSKKKSTWFLERGRYIAKE